MSNILLIDNRVENYEAIVASVRVDTTKCIVFDVNEMTLDETESSNFSIIMAMIAAEIGNGNTTIDNIGLVQHNYDHSYYQMFGNRCKRAPVIGVEEVDPTLTAHWDEVGSFLMGLKTMYNIQHFDMMACSIYSNPGWKYIIDNLSEQTGIGIRASIDITGSSSNGGNWFLESHTGVDLKTVYFTELIESYNGTLFTYNSDSKYKIGQNPTIMDSTYTASWSTLSIPTIPSAPSRPTIPSSPPSLTGDGININGMWGFPNASTYLVMPSGSALNNIIQIVSTQYGFSTLNKDGAVGVYGYGPNYSAFTSSFASRTGATVTSGVVRIYGNNEFYAALKSDGSLASWGGWYNYSSDINTRRYPTNFTITSGIVKVFVGISAMFAITSSGALVAWQTLGTFTDFSVSYPSGSSLSSGVVEVYSIWGNAHLALKSDGSIVTFGYVGFGGQAGNNHVGATFNSITSGKTSWAGIDTNGGIVLINNSNTIYNPYGVSLTSGWVKIITVDSLYFCALRNDGAVVTWRDSYASSSQTGNTYDTRYPSGINMGSGSGITNIYDLGTVGFAAITSTGRLIRWGGFSHPMYLYSGTSSTDITSGVVDVCASAGTAAALKSDGSVFIWGRDVPTGGSAFTPQNPNLGSGSGIVRIFTSETAQIVFLKSDKTMIYWSRFATGRTIANNYLGGSSISSVDTVFYSLDGFMSVSSPAPILPTITTFSIPGRTYGTDVSFNLIDPSSNSSGAFSYSSGTTSVATISGSTVTIVAAGSSVITATQAAAGAYSSGTITATLTVSLGTPTLSGTTFTVASSKVYGDASFNITTRPTSNSSGAITYTSSNTNIATIDSSGNWINIVGAGDVSFNATQAAVANQFTSATKTSNTLSIAKATPTLAFASPPTTKNVTDAAFTVTASSASLGALTYASSNTAFATVNSTTGLVTLVGPGTVTITAAQSATALYNAPANATCSIVISAAGSTLAGQTVASGTSFTGVNLAGASFANSTLSGVSFSGATLTGVNFSGATITGTDFTNANISGATNLPTFSTTQKLQLLSNINNVAISAIQITSPLSGADINAILPTPVAALSTAAFTLKVPTALDASSNKLVTVSDIDISNNTSIYIPMNANESVKINGTVFSFNGANVLDTSGNVRTYLTIADIPFKIYAGSIIGLNILSSLNALTFTGDVTGMYDIISELFVSK
jgi:uncharacterized protein YjbI with pentapeptide repeats